MAENGRHHKRENLCCGKLTPPRKKMIAAAKSAIVTAFLKRLQKAMIPLFQTATALSPQDRNNFSVSHIMLSLPPMLILDEATSSIDTRTDIGTACLWRK